jgi:hypothetical protein
MRGRYPEGLENRVRADPVVLRKNTGERMPVGSRGSAPQAIFMVQPAQNWHRDYLRMFRKAMPGGHELIRVGQRMWNARSQAGVWTTSVIVRHPFTKGPSEMFLVHGDQPIETLATPRADQSLAEAVSLRPAALEASAPGGSA